MARVNHKLVQQRLNEKRSKITDKQFFTSRLLAGHFEDMAAAQTRRYNYNRRIRVSLHWQPKDKTIAFTDNQVIHINAGHPIVTTVKGRENRYLIVFGLFSHELGHVLYTDFLASQSYFNYLEKGKWYPIDPTLSTLTEKVAERELWEYMSADPRNAQALLGVAKHISNVIEDGYIENRVLTAFPGSIGDALDMLREKNFNDMLTVTDLIEKENDGEAHIFESIMQMMLSYAKYGKIKYGEEPLTDERIQTVFSLIGDVDSALYNLSGKERLMSTNSVLIKCWSYIKDFCEYSKQKHDEAIASGASSSIEEILASIFGKMSGSSQAGSGNGAPVSDPAGTPIQSATAKARKQTQAAANSSSEENAAENQSGTGEENTSVSEPGLAGDGGADSSGKQETSGEENGRIPFHQTDDIETKGEGLFERDDDYKREMYDKAATDIEDVLEKMAEKAACKEVENERLKELNEVAQNISYGNVHAGINIRVQRIAEVDEELIDQYNYISSPLLTISRQLKHSLVKQLQESRRGGKQTGLLMGRRLDSHALHRNDGKMFYKTALPNEIPQLCVGLLLDESGSMSGSHRCTYARAAAIILYDFCRSLDIPITVYGHSTSCGGVDLYSYAEFESIDNNDKYRMMDISARGSNRDGAALRFVAEQVSKRPEEVKLLILVSDGQPAHSGYSGTAAEEDLRGIRKEYMKKGILFVAAAIGDDKQNIERIYGDSFLDITDLNQLPAKLTSVVKRHIRV